MFNIFRRNIGGEYPKFERLTQYSDRDKYFSRTKKWYWHTTTEIAVIDMPRFITLDPWPQQVFLDATGQKTIGEYIHFLAAKYSGKIPAELDETIIYQIKKLLQENIIWLSVEPQQLGPEFLNPVRLGKK